MFKTLVYAGVEYDQFEIDELGNIKNRNTGTTYKQSVGKRGYYVVTLPMGKRGKVKSIRVHKAIAETFIPNPNNFTTVNHLDENKLNNQLDNLEWTTSKMNTQYSLSRKYNKNAFSNNRKLTREDVEYIKKDKEHTYKELADQFKVSKTTISNVKNNYLYI